MILRQEIYATAALSGGACYVGLTYLGFNIDSALIIAIGCALTLRLMAIYFKLSLPAFQLDD
jgi:uncharacterized membrane protein YeiH